MMVVRPMTVNDVEAVRAIADGAFPAAWSTGTFAVELAQPGRCYLVVTEDDEVVAYGGIADQAGDAHVMALAAAPQRRRNGHATRLLAALLDVARDQLGTDRVTLEVRTSNAAALALYQQAGFVVSGTRPGYYGGEAAAVLWLDGREG